MSGVIQVALSSGLGDYIFGLDPQLLVDSAITILAMFFVFLLLSYLLFNPARNLMEKRQEGIREQMETAAREKQDAIQFKAEYDEKIKNVQKETDEILSEARKKALKKESVMLEEAREEAAQIVARANREVELEKSKVKDEMKPLMSQRQWLVKSLHLLWTKANSHSCLQTLWKRWVMRHG